MRKTTNYGLSLYEKEDKMIITAEENSLNANMEIIDKTLQEKASITDMTNYINEHKDELQGPAGKDGVDGTVTFDELTQEQKDSLKGPQGPQGPQGESGGSPIVANKSTEMTDTTQAYLFVGNETGYTSGHWYYYNGSQWVDGGEYGAYSENNTNIYTFLDAYISWKNDEKFPIAFYGDSTFYGTNTSGKGYTFCDILQLLIRNECESDAPTIYKVATAGDTLKGGISKFEGYFGSNGTYADTKMLGIGYGINDRLGYSSYKEYKEGVYKDLETIIKKCYEKNIQPFLITSQATNECGVMTQYTTVYPLRDSNTMNICANGAKKELAKKYNIPLIDLNKFTELYLLNSNVPANEIISDRLHFGNVGHKYEGGFFFSNLVSRVIPIEKRDRYIISYSNQNLKNCIPEEKISYGTGDFKVYANYTKTDTTDTKIMDAYVFVEEYQATLKAYKNSGGETYIKLDGEIAIMNSNELDLGNLELGLHHLEVFTGESSTVNFKGFIINESIVISGDTGGDTGGDNEPTTLTSILATYDGGEVEVGTSLNNLTDLTVTAIYSDGSTKPVTNYTLSGEIVEGENTITVTYEGLTTTFIVVGKSNTGEDTGGNTEKILYDVKEYITPTLVLKKDTVVPYAITFGFNVDTKTSGLSNTTITKIKTKFNQSGIVTIGKIDLKEYGTGNMTPLNQKQYTVATSGEVEVDIDDLTLGENETILVGSMNDTALMYFGTQDADPSKNGGLITPDGFKDALSQTIVTNITVYGYRN